MALRTRCTSGSASASTITLSISVSSPIKVRVTGLPVRRAVSRTTRRMRWNTPATGTSRIADTSLCSSRIRSSSLWLAATKPSSSRPASSG